MRSRDSDQKIYVQDRMLEHAAELWQWLEEGAYFYVCGDAKRMARDVDQMLCRIVAEEDGGERGGRIELGVREEPDLLELFG